MSRNLSAEQFTDSGWPSGTAARKARFVNALLGFIAHYDIHGFYDEQLSTPERRSQFITDLRRGCERGSGFDRPENWSDVKAALAVHLSPREPRGATAPAGARTAAGSRRAAAPRYDGSNDQNLWMVFGGVTCVGAPSRG